MYLGPFQNKILFQNKFLFLFQNKLCYFYFVLRSNILAYVILLSEQWENKILFKFFPTLLWRSLKILVR
jgi:hypothetical protein